MTAEEWDSLQPGDKIISIKYKTIRTILGIDQHKLDNLDTYVPQATNLNLKLRKPLRHKCEQETYEGWDCDYNEYTIYSRVPRPILVFKQPRLDLIDTD